MTSADVDDQHISRFGCLGNANDSIAVFVGCDEEVWGHEQEEVSVEMRKERRHGNNNKSVCVARPTDRPTDFIHLRTTDIRSSDHRHVPIDSKRLVLNHIGIGHADADAAVGASCPPPRTEGEQRIEEE